MRRRSDRKISTEACSPATPGSRRSSRRSRKSPVVERVEEIVPDVVTLQTTAAEKDVQAEHEENVRASSEEPIVQPTRKSRSSRKRTPASEHGSPAKRKHHDEKIPESIPEEENGATEVRINSEEKQEDSNENSGNEPVSAEPQIEQPQQTEESIEIVEIGETQEQTERLATPSPDRSTAKEDDDDGDEQKEEEAPKNNDDERNKEQTDDDQKSCLEIETEENSVSSESKLPEDVISSTNVEETDANDSGPNDNDDDDAEQQPQRQSPMPVKESAKDVEENTEVDDGKDEIITIATRYKKTPSRETSVEVEEAAVLPVQPYGDDDEQEDGECAEQNIVELKEKKNPKKEEVHVSKNRLAVTSVNQVVVAARDAVIEKAQQQQQQQQQRKRKWLTKKVSDCCKTPILSISTDSLKNLIADVQPVPLSDVQLDSSSDVEGGASELEDGEKSPTPDRDQYHQQQQQHGRRSSQDRTLKRHQSNDSTVAAAAAANTSNTSTTTTTTTTTPTKSSTEHGDRGARSKKSSSEQRSPSPARHQLTSVLFITNLVRPFTVMQLKGLLARTGKIVENGFWIDRIKSKCYVQYETEDEATETRHALHGVRWPVSNPKCLNVDFGDKADMDKAVASTQEDTPKFGQDKDNKDNQIGGSGWNRERNDDDKKNSRHVREWDVGKKENLDRDNNKLGRGGNNNDDEPKRRNSRDRDAVGVRGDDIKTADNNERKNRNRDRDPRSSSQSPVRKLKRKENDPPLRLLDDLFRKTKAAPCIYWLPLTPEQIAEKEAFRQKRIEEHKERMKQRELERGKEREKERTRTVGDRDRNDAGRDHRRNNSIERRRSRSRDRRRY